MQAKKTNDLKVEFLYDEDLGWRPSVVDGTNGFYYLGEYRSTFAEAVFHAGKAIEGGL